jgi:flagellar basal body-associated protein FliL
MKNKTLAIVAIVTVAAAAMLVSAYNYASAKKYGDSNAQPSAANNDCPAAVIPDFDIELKLQTNAASCLNDINMVQDDGTAIASIPSNTAPSQ